jgi:pyridoxal phosphate enzyme (YggS family)
VIKVTENIEHIETQLALSAIQAGRDPGTVKLLAVSKKQPLSKILEAAAAGQRDFGENFVQEGIEKIEAAGRNDLVWHFIGHLQSNKTREVAESFDWVHSIDRRKIAQRLSEQRPAELPPLNVCIQVNVDAEASKSGVSPADVADLAEAISAMPGLKLRGLMCLPAIRDSLEEQRKPFRALRQLLEALNAEGMNLDTLSMGMSDDFDAAILEGATIVRIGTAVFGPRQ